MDTSSLLQHDQTTKCSLRDASDESLVDAAKQGSQLAFAEVCRRHSRLIFSTAYRITKNREDAEDVCQDATLKAFVHLKTFDGRSKFSTWLTRIAINSALMTMRRRRIQNEISIDRHFDDDTLALMEIPDAAKNIDLHYIEHEAEIYLRKAVDRLSPVLRDVLEIRLSSEGSVQDIAQKAGISVAAAKSRLSRGRQALRRYINERDAKPMF
jgi:RNA polymerase sigma factor (sigma-70 family)